MKIILKQAVTGLGGPGTIKEVTEGYARNFLLPRGLAELATPEKIRELEVKQEVKTKELEGKREQFQQILGELGKLNLVFKRKVTKTGKLFAAVSNKLLAEELTKSLKVGIDPEMIVINQPIKSVGEYSVKLILASDLQGEFKITITEDK